MQAISEEVYSNYDESLYELIVFLLRKCECLHTQWAK